MTCKQISLPFGWICKRANLDEKGFDEFGWHWGVGDPFWYFTDGSDSLTVRAKSLGYAICIAGQDGWPPKNVGRVGWGREQAMSVREREKQEESSSLHTGICVGGPLAGQQFAVPNQDFSFIVSTTSGSVNDPITKDKDNTVAYTTTTYHAETFRTQDGEITIWRPKDQSTHETMKILLESYARACRRIPR